MFKILNVLRCEYQFLGYTLEDTRSGAFIVLSRGKTEILASYGLITNADYNYCKGGIIGDGINLVKSRVTVSEEYFNSVNIDDLIYPELTSIRPKEHTYSYYGAVIDKRLGITCGFRIVRDDGEKINLTNDEIKKLSNKQLNSCIYINDTDSFVNQTGLKYSTRYITNGRAVYFYRVTRDMTADVADRLFGKENNLYIDIDYSGYTYGVVTQKMSNELSENILDKTNIMSENGGLKVTFRADRVIVVGLKMKRSRLAYNSLLAPIEVIVEANGLYGIMSKEQLVDITQDGICFTTDGRSINDSSEIYNLYQYPLTIDIPYMNYKSKGIITII